MKKNLSLSVILFAAAISNAFSQGDLLVSPVRIVFEGSKQKEEISLVNIGNDTVVYNVSFLQYNMTEDGIFQMISNQTEDQMFADKYLRVFPRQIKLAPRESQVVRIQLRRSSDMVAGEYRSHLYFRAEKESKPLGAEVAKDQKLMSVQITPVFGISIPVIIRNGDVKVTSEINNLKLETSQGQAKTLNLSINRTGNMSVYGDIVVDYIPFKGKPVEVGSMRGVAIYTSVNKRNFSLKLDENNVKLSGGRLRVRFTSPKDVPYQSFAEKDLSLN
jgi:P pilus assembly chaperone PapD